MKMIQKWIFFFLAISGSQFPLSILAQTTPYQGRVSTPGGVSIEGVFIEIAGTYKSTFTDKNGEFKLETKRKLPFTLIFSKNNLRETRHLVEDTTEIHILLDSISNKLDKEILSPSLTRETIGTCPVSAERLDHVELANSPNFNYYQTVGNARGVSMTTTGMQLQSVNSSGFSSTTNRRFLQLVDGADTRVPGEGYSMGNLNGISELDIDHMEITPINSSPIYGSNAMNGLLSITSKSPFDYQGLGVLGRFGVANVETFEGNDATPLYEIGLRYAYAFQEKVGIKINYSLFESDDWQGTDRQNIRPGSLANSTRVSDPGYDGANLYGDEITGALPFGQSGSDLVISRTGYPEKDLADYKVDNQKVDAALHIRIVPSVEAIVQYAISESNSMFRSDHRNVLEDVETERFRLELRGRNFFIHRITSTLDAGRTYDLELLGIDLNLLAKTNTEWFTDYSTLFTMPPFDQTTHIEAREFADGIGLNLFGQNQPRFVPGDPFFEPIKQSIINGEIQNLIPVQAQFETNTKLTQWDGLYDFTHLQPWIELQVGFNGRKTQLDPTSTLITDVFLINDFEQLGFFAQIGKGFFKDQLKLMASVRLDNSDLYDEIISPRASATYSLNETHHFRASFNQGFRYPSIQEMFIQQISGEGELRGGLRNLNSLFLFQSPTGNSPPLVGNTILEKNVIDFGIAVDQEVAAGTNISTAVNNNLDILDQGVLEAGDLTLLQPEENITFEVGYRTFLDQKLVLDISYYQNEIDNFIGQVGLINPIMAQPPGDNLLVAAGLVLDSRSRRKITYYQNAKSSVTSRGVMLGVDYALPKNYWIGLNGTWSSFSRENEDDLVNVGLNVPEYRANFFFGNPRVADKVGFQVNLRWQDGFTWESAFGQGEVGSYAVVDGQISYHLLSNLTLKIGGNNLFNSSYRDHLGGAAVGGLYYVSILLDGVLKI